MRAPTRGRSLRSVCDLQKETLLTVMRAGSDFELRSPTSPSFPQLITLKRCQTLVELSLVQKICVCCSYAGPIISTPRRHIVEHINQPTPMGCAFFS